MKKIVYGGYEFKGNKWVPDKTREEWITRGRTVGSVRNPQELKLKKLYVELGPREFNKRMELRNRERRKEQIAEFRRQMKTGIEDYWGEFKKEKASIQSDIGAFRQQIYSNVPRFKLTSRQKVPGQRGYIPIGKRGFIKKEQARRTAIRTEALKPVRETEQQLAKAEKDIRAQAKQFGAQLN